MNRRYLLLSVALLFVAAADAQIARWLVEPLYDSIQVQDNGLYVAMKEGRSFLIKDGVTLFSEEGIDIGEFREGRAVVLSPGTNRLAGVLGEDGNYINFSDYNYQVDANYPYYSDGWLLLRNENGFYYYASPEGAVNGPYAEAWPFSCGLAVVKSFRDLEKPNVERSTWCYIDTELKEVALPEQTDNRDVEFLSSLSDDKGIVVVKKVYKLYDKKLHQYLPLYADTLRDKKKEKPVAVTVVPTGVVPVLEEDIWRVTARNAEMRLDARRRPLNIVYPATATRKDRVVNKFHPVDYMSPEPETDLEVFSDDEAATRRGNQYGLLLLLPRDTVELLPPQLKAIIDLHGDRAVVQSSKTNLFGVLQVERDQDFRFSLNDGMQVGFLHDTYDTSLKLVFPRLLQDKTVMVESSDEKHIKIKKDTKGYVINDEVCSVSYDCQLIIPNGEGDMGIDDHIVDDGSSQYLYTLYVNYDGLKSRNYQVGLDQWYMKNYSVKLGNITAETIDLEIVQEQNSSGFYKNIEAEIFDADSVRQAHLTLGNGLVKNTENRLVAMLDGVKSTNYTLHVTIKEGKCPQVYFDFPIANKATKVAERQAEIQKKECVKCHKLRALNQFSNDSDICSICVKAASQPARPAVSTAHVVVPPKKDNTRVCSKCKKKKSLSQFSRNSNICKSCVF